MKTCAKEGCSANAKARGLCANHYQHIYRAGLLERMPERSCSVVGCGKKHLARGLCSTHYSRYKRDALDGLKCSVGGCKKNASALGFCSNHYQRFKKTGSTAIHISFMPNEFIDNNDGTHSIILRNRMGKKNGETIIDTDCVDLLSGYKWHLLGGYAATNVNGTRKRLHQIIFPVQTGFLTDHIDRNKLNNRRSNLRRATFTQNLINKDVRSDNKSGIIGVYYLNWDKKWYSSIRINEKHNIRCGFFDKNEAIIHRLQSEKRYYGEFAPQRHLFEEYGI